MLPQLSWLETTRLVNVSRFRVDSGVPPVSMIVGLGNGFVESGVIRDADRRGQFLYYPWTAIHGFGRRLSSSGTGLGSDRLSEYRYPQRSRRPLPFYIHQLATGDHYLNVVFP